ncbi:hypothetical protein [Halomonas sp. WWR20]
MQGTDFKDLAQTPERVYMATAGLARNCVHLARSLGQSPYPAQNAE